MNDEEVLLKFANKGKIQREIIDESMQPGTTQVRIIRVIRMIDGVETEVTFEDTGRRWLDGRVFEETGRRPMLSRLRDSGI